MTVRNSDPPTFGGVGSVLNSSLPLVGTESASAADLVSGRRGESRQQAGAPRWAAAGRRSGSPHSHFLDAGAEAQSGAWGDSGGCPFPRDLPSFPLITGVQERCLLCTVTGSRMRAGLHHGAVRTALTQTPGAGFSRGEREARGATPQPWGGLQGRDAPSPGPNPGNWNLSLQSPSSKVQTLGPPEDAP